MKPFPSGIVICLGISALIAATSCKKTTTPVPPPGSGTGSDNPPANTNYLSSIKNLQFSSVLDSFTYDNSNRLTKIMISYGDSANINVGPIQAKGTNLNSSTVTFSYAGNNTAPASYTIVNTYDNKTHLHQLSYDGQNRIIKDTDLNNTGAVATWSYPNGNIASSLSSGTGVGILDTVFLTNGNVTAQHTYGFGGTPRPDTVFNSITNNFSTIVNPNYHRAISSTYGPLFMMLGLSSGLTDYISVNGISSITNTSKIIGLDNLPGGTITDNYTWTMDGNKRAATLKITDSKVGALGNLKFSYY